MIHREVMLFFGLTFGVVVVSLVIGLLIRSSLAGSADGTPVKLMKLETAAATATDDGLDEITNGPHLLRSAAGEGSSVKRNSVKTKATSSQAVAVDVRPARPHPKTPPHASSQTLSQAFASKAANSPPPSKPPTFAGRPLRKVREVSMLVTAYSPDARSCGKWADGVTASGYSVTTNGMKLVAADTDLLPFGSIVTIPGYDDGHPVPVLDRGGAIRGRRLDVLYPTHRRATKWGSQRLTVTVWEYAD